MVVVVQLTEIALHVVVQVVILVQDVILEMFATQIQ